MKDTKAPFAVGDAVTSDYFRDEATVVRRVTVINQDAHCESGWRAAVDGGDECKTCGRRLGTPIHGVDSAWCKPWPIEEATK